MDMTGEYRIAAPRERVWAALNDAGILRQAIPGCEELNKISETEMEAVAKAKIGPVSARFKGKVTLSELNPPHGYTLSGEGSAALRVLPKATPRLCWRSMEKARYCATPSKRQSVANSRNWAKGL